jgi:hypothetical protein
VQSQLADLFGSVLFCQQHLIFAVVQQLLLLTLPCRFLKPSNEQEVSNNEAQGMPPASELSNLCTLSQPYDNWIILCCFRLITTKEGTCRPLRSSLQIPSPCSPSLRQAGVQLKDSDSA